MVPVDGWMDGRPVFVSLRAPIILPPHPLKPTQPPTPGAVEGGVQMLILFSTVFGFQITNTSLRLWTRYHELVLPLIMAPH